VAGEACDGMPPLPEVDDHQRQEAGDDYMKMIRSLTLKRSKGHQRGEEAGDKHEHPPPRAGSGVAGRLIGDYLGCGRTRRGFATRILGHLGLSV
jgi:hypothetical protein